MIIQPIIASDLKSPFSVREASKLQKIALVALETLAISSFVLSAALLCVGIPALQTGAVILAITSVATAMVWMISFYAITSSVRLKNIPETPHLQEAEEGVATPVIPLVPAPIPAPVQRRGCLIPPSLQKTLDDTFSHKTAEIAPIDHESLDKQSKKLLDSLRLQFPVIFYRKDFQRFDGKHIPKESDLSQLKPFIEEIFAFILDRSAALDFPMDQTQISAHLESVIKYLLLPEEELSKNDLLQFSQALFQLLPLLIQIYREEGPQRTEIFSRLKSRDLELFNLFFQRDDFNKVAHLRDSFFFLFQRVTSTTEPLALFLQKNHDNSFTFLHQLLHLFTFSLLPYQVMNDQKNLLRREKFISSILCQCPKLRIQLEESHDVAIKTELEQSLSVLEIRMANEALLTPSLQNVYQLASSFVIPHLSKMCASDNISTESLSEYNQELEKWFAFQSVAPNEVTGLLLSNQALPVESPALQTEHLPPFASFFTKFSKEFAEKSTSEYTLVKEAIADNSAHLSLFEDGEKIGHTLQQFSSELFGDSVMDAGEFVAKSCLLSQSLPGCFSAEEGQEEFIKDIVSSIAKLLTQGGYNASFLETAIDQVLVNMGQHMNTVAPEVIQLLKCFPFHDTLFLLLLGFFALRHLSEVRPFIKNHLDSAFQLMHLLEMNDILKHERVIRFSIKSLLALLAPIEKTVTTKLPIGKNTAIRSSVNTGWWGFKKLASTQAKENQAQTTKNSKKKTNTFTEDEIKALDAMKDLFLFATLGIFGSNGKETKAFGILEEKLRELYQALYTFDLNEMAQDPEAFKKHIKTALDSLKKTDYTLKEAS